MIFRYDMHKITDGSLGPGFLLFLKTNTIMILEGNFLHYLMMLMILVGRFDYNREIQWDIFMGLQSLYEKSLLR